LSESPDVAAAAKEYGRVLGVPAPKMERGTVIHADMAIYQLGPTGLELAQPLLPRADGCACGSSGGSACGAGGVMAWGRGAGKGARGRGGR
jgi:hypothetical protein